MSRGSNAILCPFSPPVYDVSGDLSFEDPALGAGEATRLESSSSSIVEAPPPPRRRVNPPVEAIVQEKVCSREPGVSQILSSGCLAVVHGRLIFWKGDRCVVCQIAIGA